MIKTRTAQFLICLALILSAGSIAFGDQPPDWLQEAAKAKTPDFDIKNVPAVILRNEESIVVSPDGTVVKTVRYAVRVLIREGREEAVAKAVYQTDGEKVRDLTAWLIPSNGQVKNYGKKEVLDISLAEDDVWDQARIKVIDASNMAEAGDVFGYESVTEEHTVFSQFQFAFQHDLPVIAAKFDLSLPTGWKAESVTFNRDKVEPVVSGNTYAWELRNLPDQS